MPYKLTMKLTKPTTTTFKQFVDAPLAEYIRQKYPVDNGLDTRTVLKYSDTEWIAEFLFQQETSYYTIMADAVVATAHTQWVNYNNANSIIEETVGINV